ncbi:MAG: FtsX-like permease family protein [Bacteroidota bacterium]
MKGKSKTGNRGIGLRNEMLVVQYALSLILIVGTFTIYNQLNYFRNTDVGFEKENILIVENVDWTGSQEEFRDEIAKIKGVAGTSLSDSSPMYISNGDQFIPDEPDAGSIPLNFAVADENYLDLLSMELVLGRYFDKSYSSDSAAVLINETAARTIGWEVNESILNNKIGNHTGKYHIIGVLKDFNFWSLHAPIEPFAIFNSKSKASFGPLTRVLVKMRTTEENKDQVIEKIEAKWQEFLPNRPFEYVLLTDHYLDSYKTEARFGGVLSFFAVLTIIIASLGLFGIVVFAAEQKLKEIGIRKVLGASLSSLILLYSKNYVKLLIIAFAIASPIGYYCIDNWLSDFEYRTQINPLLFVLSFAILLCISLSIAIFHTTRASMMNPAEVLKDE